MSQNSVKVQATVLTRYYNGKKQTGNAVLFETNVYKTKFIFILDGNMSKSTEKTAHKSDNLIIPNYL
jgi:hypothetical protein